MVSEARLPQVGGQPAALLWLQLVLLPPWAPTTTLNLRGSWAHPGPAPAAVPAVEGGPLTPEAQPLAWAATGGRGVSTACGKPKVMWRISGGQDVVAGQWPWQASLMYQGLHVCGAVLINSRWLVSAAHCFLKKSHAPENYRVLLGSTQLFEPTQHTLEMSVSQIVMHPDFEKLHPFGSDIAMLQLLFPVNFTSYIIPACLPAPGLQLPNNASCWITGWGMLNEETPLPTPFHLQEAKVGLIENQFCNLVYGHRLSKNFSVYEEMLCVGDFSTGKAICHGDSGGPLVCDLISSWVLVGLASWGLDCRHPTYPSIFTNVSYFSHWIDEIQKCTPLPEPMAPPPHTQVPSQSLQAAGSPGPGTAFVPSETWTLLLFVLRVPWQAWC